MRQVEDALVAYAEEKAHRAALAEAFGQTQESLDLIRQSYDHGLADFLEVLDAQRTMLATQDQLVQSDQTITTDVASLYKALGGGWQTSE